MLKQGQIPEADQNEVFKIADELLHADSNQREQAIASRDAAAELGVSQEYLDRAAEELHLRRLEQLKVNRAKRRILWGTIVFAMTILVITAVFLSTAVTLRASTNNSSTFNLRSQAATMNIGTVYLIPDLTQSAVRSNPESQGELTKTSSAITLQLDAFGLSANKKYFVNIVLDPINVKEFVGISLNASNIGIPNIRVDLEAGNTRWKGPVTVASGRNKLVARDFQRQLNTPSGWKNTTWSPPAGKVSVVVKTGETINGLNAKGTLTVTDVELTTKQ